MKSVGRQKRERTRRMKRDKQLEKRKDLSISSCARWDASITTSAGASLLLAVRRGRAASAAQTGGWHHQTSDLVRALAETPPNEAPSARRQLDRRTHSAAQRSSGRPIWGWTQTRERRGHARLSPGSLTSGGARSSLPAAGQPVSG